MKELRTGIYRLCDEAGLDMEFADEILKLIYEEDAFIQLEQLDKAEAVECSHALGKKSVVNKDVSDRLRELADMVEHGEI